MDSTDPSNYFIGNCDLWNKKHSVQDTYPAETILLRNPLGLENVRSTFIVQLTIIGLHFVLHYR